MITEPISTGRLANRIGKCHHIILPVKAAHQIIISSEGESITSISVPELSKSRLSSCPLRQSHFLPASPLRDIDLNTNLHILSSLVRRKCSYAHSLCTSLVPALYTSVSMPGSRSRCENFDSTLCAMCSTLPSNHFIVLGACINVSVPNLLAAGEDDNIP